MSRRVLRIGVFGAGSIGCLIGGRLAHAGADVVLLGRPVLADAVNATGLHISDYTGADLHLPAGQIDVVTEPAGLAGCDIVLVTTKSRDTAAAGDALAGVIDAQCLVVSLQNGVRNPDILRAALPDNVVLAGMVPFNVRWAHDASFHQGTSGYLEIERHHRASGLIDLFGKVGVAARTSDAITAVQWGKLVINLNNAVNALSGLPLKTQLAQRAYRRVMVALQREALTVLRAAEVPIKSSGGLPVPLVPWLLSSPDWLFRRLLPAVVKVDDEARSSMWEDLNRGRPTEVDFLNGEIVRLAEQIGSTAPANAAIAALVHEAEGADAPPAMTADALLTAVRR